MLGMEREHGTERIKWWSNPRVIRWIMVTASLALLVIAMSRAARNHRRAKAREEAQMPVHRKLERLTGARTKVAWLRDHSKDRRDIFANGGDLSLMVMDTEGSDPFRMLVARGPLRRPLIAPDGSSIIFSRMTRWKEEAEASERTCEICRIPWHGGEVEVVGPGYAVDFWQAPDGRTWIYAVERMAGAGANHNGSSLVRFPVDNPQQRETVLRGREITTDNFQIDRAGASASVLMPWPSAGTVELGGPPEGVFHPLVRGCWPSLAPDDSGLAWIFDGPHKRLRMIHQAAGRAWDLPLYHVDGMRKAAGYHPRWSNHPSFIAWTGPYRKRFHQSGAGREACVFVGRLNAAADDVDAAIRLDDGATQPDLYPDLWIAGGGTASLDAAALAGARSARPFHVLTRAGSWPGTTDGLRWAWKAARVEHTETEEAFGVPQLRGYSWLARDGVLCLQGGWADAGPWKGVAPPVDAGWGLTMVAEPLRPGGIIFSSPLVTVSQTPDGRIAVTHGGGSWASRTPLPLGTATVIVLDQTPDREAPGCHFGPDAVAMLPAAMETITSSDAILLGAGPDGSRPWHGLLAGISLWSGDRAASLAIRTADALREAMPWTDQPRLVVRLKIEAVSEPLEPEDLGSYRRAWAGGVAEVLDVQRGTLPHRRINVAWWTIMDRRPLPEALPRPGSEVTLEIEPTTLHPFFESERGADDLEEESLPWYIAIQPVG